MTGRVEALILTGQRHGVALLKARDIRRVAGAGRS